MTALTPVSLKTAPSLSLFQKTVALGNYIPIISTVTSVALIIFKSFVMPFVQASTISKSRHLKWIDNTSIWTSALLLLPVLGNISFYLINQSKARREARKNSFLEEMKKGNIRALDNLSSNWRNDPTLMLELLQASNYCDDVIEYASESLKDDPIFMKNAISNCPRASRYLSQRLVNQHKGRFILSLLRDNDNNHNQFILLYALMKAPELAHDPAFFEAAVQIDGLLLGLADVAIKRSLPICRLAVQKTPASIGYLELQFQDTVRKSFPPQTERILPANPPLLPAAKRRADSETTPNKANASAVIGHSHLSVNPHLVRTHSGTQLETTTTDRLLTDTNALNSSQESPVHPVEDTTTSAAAASAPLPPPLPTALATTAAPRSTTAPPPPPLPAAPLATTVAPRSTTAPPPPPPPPPPIGETTVTRSEQETASQSGQSRAFLSDIAARSGSASITAGLRPSKAKTSAGASASVTVAKKPLASSSQAAQRDDVTVLSLIDEQTQRKEQIRKQTFERRIRQLNPLNAMNRQITIRRYRTLDMENNDDYNFNYEDEVNGWKALKNDDEWDKSPVKKT